MPDTATPDPDIVTLCTFQSPKCFSCCEILVLELFEWIFELVESGLLSFFSKWVSIMRESVTRSSRDDPVETSVAGFRYNCLRRRSRVLVLSRLLTSFVRGRWGGSVLARASLLGIVGSECRE